MQSNSTRCKVFLLSSNYKIFALTFLAESKGRERSGHVTQSLEGRSRVFTARKEPTMDVPDDAGEGGREISVLRGH